MVGGFLTNQACVFVAVERPGGTNLTLDIAISLWWQGYSGLQSQKRQKIKTLEEVDLGPDFICFYRGNNLWKLSARKVKIVADDMLEFIRSRFSNSYGDMVVHICYSAPCAMEKTRKRINSNVATMIVL